MIRKSAQPLYAVRIFYEAVPLLCFVIQSIVPCSEYNQNGRVFPGDCGQAQAKVTRSDAVAYIQ